MRHVQDDFEPAATFSKAKTRRPESRQRRREALSRSRIALTHQPAQARTEVLVVPLDAGEPNLGVLTKPERTPATDDRVREKQRVPPLDLLRLASLLQLLGGILPQRLQHAIPEGSVGLWLGLHQRLVYQLAEQVQRGARCRFRDGTGGIQRPTSTEDRQILEKRTFGFVQQVVAPVDERSQRAVPGQRVATAASQQLEALVQPRRELLHREGPQTCGGQLERE